MAAPQERLPTDEEIDNELLMLAGGWRAPSPDTSDSDWAELDESTEQELAAVTEAAEKAAAELMVDDAPPPQWPAPGWLFGGYSTQDQEMMGHPGFMPSGGPTFNLSFGVGEASTQAPNASSIGVDMSSAEMSGEQETPAEKMEDEPPAMEGYHVSFPPTSSVPASATVPVSEEVELNATSDGPDAEDWLTKLVLEHGEIPTPRSGSPPCATTETPTDGRVSSVTTAKDSSDEANECLFDTARMEAHQESNKYDMAVAKAAVREAELEARLVPVPSLLNPALLPPYFHQGMDEQYHPVVSGNSLLDFLATSAPGRALIEAAQNMAAAKATFEAGRSGSAECQEAPKLQEAQGSGTGADESSDSEEKVSSHPTNIKYLIPTSQ